MNVGRFGDIKFYVKTEDGAPKGLSFSDYGWNSSATYEEHKRAGHKGQLEFIGPDLWTFTLNVKASALLGINPYTTHRFLREKERDGKAENLVIGGKRVTKNKWVITGIAATGSMFDTQGRAISLDLAITFTEYVGKKKKKTAATETKKTTDTTKKSKSASQETTYTTVKGDTLWGIAVSFYGSGSKYTKIYNANKDKISNPNVIPVGITIVIPE